jgi:hypothetical protein
MEGPNLLRELTTAVDLGGPVRHFGAMDAEGVFVGVARDASSTFASDLGRIGDA